MGGCGSPGTVFLYIIGEGGVEVDGPVYDWVVQVAYIVLGLLSGYLMVWHMIVRGLEEESAGGCYLSAPFKKSHGHGVGWEHG